MPRFLIAFAVALASLPAFAQAQVARQGPAANPLNFNNPLNQPGMYNQSPVLRFNNPLNQPGMYNNVPQLYFNNPLNQPGMYGSDPVLRFNDPLRQGASNSGPWQMYYNNAPNQAWMYYGDPRFDHSDSPIQRSMSGFNPTRYYGAKVGKDAVGDIHRSSATTGRGADSSPTRSPSTKARATRRDSRRR